MEDRTSTPIVLRDNRQRMRFAQMAQWARALVAFVALISYWFEYQLLQQAAQGNAISMEAADANDWRVRIISGVQFVVFLLALIALVQWCYRAYQNVHRLPGTRPTYDANRAAWGWFLPIMNLWYPFKILQDIGHTFAGFSSPDRKAPSSRWDYLLVCWWVLYIGTFIMTRITVRAAASADDSILKLLEADKVYMTGQVFTLLSALVTLSLLKIIAPYEQAVLAQHEGPEETPLMPEEPTMAPV